MRGGVEAGDGITVLTRFLLELPGRPRSEDATAKEFGRVEQGHRERCGRAGEPRDCLVDAEVARPRRRRSSADESQAGRDARQQRL